MRRLVLSVLVLIGAALGISAVTSGTPALTAGWDGGHQVLLADGDDYDTGGG